MSETLQPKKVQLDRKKLFVIGFAILFVAIAVAGIILLYPRKTAPIDHFCKALQKGSYAELQKCMPQEAWDYVASVYESDGTQGNSFARAMAEIVVETNLALIDNYGDKLKISYQVIDKKEYDNERLRKLAWALEQRLGLDADAVTEACDFLAQTTSKGTNGKNTDENDLYIVYKYREEWYLFLDPLSGLTK